MSVLFTQISEAWLKPNHLSVAPLAGNKPGRAIFLQQLLDRGSGLLSGDSSGLSKLSSHCTQLKRYLTDFSASASLLLHEVCALAPCRLLHR